MKNELGGEIIKEFAVLRAKACSHLTDNNHGDKRHKKIFIKRKLKF